MMQPTTNDKYESTHLSTNKATLPSMGKISGISVPGLAVKLILPNSCHDTTGSITPPGPPNSMLWGLRSRPIYFSQFAHPHILTHTAPALNWGCGGCGSMGSSRLEHACATSTHTRCVPLIFPIAACALPAAQKMALPTLLNRALWGIGVCTWLLLHHSSISNMPGGPSPPRRRRGEQPPRRQAWWLASQLKEKSEFNTTRSREGK